MLRRVLSLTTLVACFAVQALAAERATFILTDGSRQSGLVAFHGTGNRNIIDNFLNLAEAQGPDKTIPVDQVAIIDFAGGDPTVAEFQQLPGDQAHLLVMRGGGMQRGRLVNLVNGDTVQWQNEAGQAQQYGIRDVSRIFLNAQASRQLFPQLAASATSAPAQIPQETAAPMPPGAVRVNANQGWIATGQRVSKGQRVAFSAAGEVRFSPDPAHTSSPDGYPSFQAPNLPVPGAAIGALIGRVGDSAPFAIGSNRLPIQMPAAGALMLGVNDTELSDNAGSFTVTFSRSR